MTHQGHHALVALLFCVSPSPMQCKRAVLGFDRHGPHRERGVFSEVRASPPGPAPLGHHGVALHPHRCAGVKMANTCVRQSKPEGLVTSSPSLISTTTEVYSWSCFASSRNLTRHAGSYFCRRGFNERKVFHAYEQASRDRLPRSRILILYISRRSRCVASHVLPCPCHRAGGVPFQ